MPLIVQVIIYLVTRWKLFLIGFVTRKLESCPLNRYKCEFYTSVRIVITCIFLNQTPKAYKDSDYKQYWMPDDNCRECYDCGMKFHAFRRRHHCRICGQIFCSQCCDQAVPGKIMGFTGENLLYCLPPPVYEALRLVWLMKSVRCIAERKMAD